MFEFEGVEVEWCFLFFLVVGFFLGVEGGCLEIGRLWI